VDAAREKEHTCRRLTCAFVQECGQKLRLPQLSIATAIVFFHRFYSRMSYEHYDRFTVATTCLFLASKVEETPKKLKDVVIESFKIHHNVDKAPEADSKDFFELKEKILVCERILLQALGFDLTVEHAYRPLLGYVKSIKGTRDLAQVAWNFINDSLRTTISLQYAPRHLAAAATALAAKYFNTHTNSEFNLPGHPTGGKWFISFQVRAWRPARARSFGTPPSAWGPRAQASSTLCGRRAIRLTRRRLTTSQGRSSRCTDRRSRAPRS